MEKLLVKLLLVILSSQITYAQTCFGIVLLSISTACGQNSTQSNVQPDWVERESSEIPRGMEILEGVNRNGNKKYWIEIKGHKVYISPENCKKYKSGEIDIVIVTWYNPHKGILRYTTRGRELVMNNRCDYEAKDN
jgi:hypothetical protein